MQICSSRRVSSMSYRSFWGSLDLWEGAILLASSLRVEQAAENSSWDSSRKPAL